MLSRSIFVSVAFVLLSCGGGTPQSATLSSTWVAPAILSNVPADSPYLIASLEPLSDAMRQRMMRGFDKQFSDLMRVIDRSRAEATTLEPWMRAMLALMDELRGKGIANWEQALGFDPKGRFALYGLSMWPVARIDVSNPARLRSVIDHVMSAAGVQLKQATLGGHNYWSAGDREVTFVAAVLEREAVAAMIPTQALTSALPFVLGVQKPAKSLASTSWLPELLGRHHFLSFVVAYIDARNAVDIVTSQKPSDLDAPLHAMTGPIPPACRTDLDRLVSAAPRLVLGYRRLDETAFDGGLLLEVAPSVATALGKLRAAVPGVTATTTGRPLASFGAAIKPDELVAWLRGVSTQIHDHPFTCPWLAGINKAAGDLGQKLASPLPPQFQGIRGFSVVVDDATITPLSVDGQLLVAGERIADVVTQLASSVPVFAGVALKPDGRPVAIPTEQLGIPISSAHIGMLADRVVVATGAASARRVTTALATPTPQVSPLFMMAFNMPRFTKLMASIGKAENFNFGSLGDMVMSLDVTADGLSFDISGNWSDTAAAPMQQAKP